jgi:hypothetical protein
VEIFLCSLVVTYVWFAYPKLVCVFLGEILHAGEEKKTLAKGL